jgi:transcriptional regulator with XRE-family HTH domain
MTHEEMKIAFGRRMRLAREEKRMSQEVLGEKIGTTKSAISGYEAGHTDPRSSLLQPIADALGVSHTWLGKGVNVIELGEDPEKAQIGSEIRTIRESKGLSQRELAELIGSDQKQIYRWETGKQGITVERLEQIARALKTKFVIGGK